RMCRSVVGLDARGGSPSWPCRRRGRSAGGRETRPVLPRTKPRSSRAHSPAGGLRLDHIRLRRTVAKRTGCRYSASWRDLSGGYRRRLGGCEFTRRLRRQPISTSSETRPPSIFQLGESRYGSISPVARGNPPRPDPDRGLSWVGRFMDELFGKV